MEVRVYKGNLYDSYTGRVLFIWKLYIALHMFIQILVFCSACCRLFYMYEMRENTYTAEKTSPNNSYFASFGLLPIESRKQMHANRFLFLIEILNTLNGTVRIFAFYKVWHLKNSIDDVTGGRGLQRKYANPEIRGVEKTWNVSKILHKLRTAFKGPTVSTSVGLPVKLVKYRNRSRKSDEHELEKLSKRVDPRKKIII